MAVSSTTGSPVISGNASPLRSSVDHRFRNALWVGWGRRAALGGLHRDNVKLEALRPQRRDRFRTQRGPLLKGRRGDRRVQVQQELVGEAARVDLRISTRSAARFRRQHFLLRKRPQRNQQRQPDVGHLVQHRELRGTRRWARTRSIAAPSRPASTTCAATPPASGTPTSPRTFRSPNA